MLFRSQRCLFFEKGSGLEINENINPELLRCSLAVKLSEFILKTIHNLGSLKATSGKKNFPRKFAKEFRDLYAEECKFDAIRIKFCKVTSEDDVPYLRLLRGALTECGWIKFQKGSFLLSKKGVKLAVDGFSIKELTELLRFYLTEVNWGYGDRMPNVFEIQHHAYFLLYIIHRKADDFITSDEVGMAMLTALPQITGSFSDHVYFGRDPETTICNICDIRFIQRFCSLFGLLDISKQPNSSKVFDEETICRKSELFKNLFVWQIP